MSFRDEEVINEPVAEMLVQDSRVLRRIQGFGVVIYDVSFFLDGIEVDVPDKAVLPAHVADEMEAAIFVDKETAGHEVSCP